MGFCRVLVTGGAGFIGSHVVDGLVRSGYSVRVLDDLSSGRLDNIGLHVTGGAVEFFEGDVRDRGLVERLVGEVDAVVHLAAVVSVPFSVENPSFTFDVNVNGTRNLVEACALSGVEKFVFASSCAVYGEAQYLPIDEGHPKCPMSPYASSKLEGERVCLGFAERSGKDVTALRFFNVYGPRQTSGEYSGVITKFFDCAEKGESLVIYGDGSQTRDFVFVSDVVNAVLMLLRHERVEGVFNIGCGEAVSIRDLAGKVLELTGKDLCVVYKPPRTGDIPYSVADVSKARQAFGFRPQVSLDDGLRSLLIWRDRSGN